MDSGGSEGMGVSASREGSLEDKLIELSREEALGVDTRRLLRLLVLDRLLERWGRAVALFGFQGRSERHDRYFLEALYAARWLPEEGEALDVGSGGGTPALPMALVRPGLRWILLEPSGRKCVFLEEAATELELENVRVRRLRWEHYQPGGRRSVVTMRGLAVGPGFFGRMGSWTAPGGRLLVFTGTKRWKKMEGQFGRDWAVHRSGPVAPRFDTELGVLVRR